MNIILVSLVSEQTIPNILAIHYFKPDEVLFISSEKMEAMNKTSAILKTLERLGLNYKSDPVVVKEDSILDCHKKLNKRIEGKEDADFLVNLTGGTKIMSIAAYEFFRQEYKCKMIYIPIPKNKFITPFPIKSPDKPVTLDLRLDVVQYLIAYGLKVLNEEKLKKYKDEASHRRELSEYIVKHYQNIKALFSWLYEQLSPYRNKNRCSFNEKFKDATFEESQFLEKFGFAYHDSTVSKELTRSEIKYLTGGWLEEFCFNIISEFIGKGIDDAVIGLRIKNNLGEENEFDVMFTKDNSLYFVECKSLDHPEDRSTYALYKIGALQKDFGLKVKCFFVTTSQDILKDKEIKESIRARAEQFKTKVIAPDEVIRLKEKISEELHIKQEEIA